MLIFILFFYIFFCNFVYGQDANDGFITPEVDVISITPIQGSGVTLDRIPSNIQTVIQNDIKENKNFSVTESLNKKTAGISISNLNSSPMQNDINFRGYVAGPL